MNTDKKLILLTGGTGYIGSHTAIELINQNYDIVIIDNLINSTTRSLDQIEQITNIKPKFHQVDLTDKSALNNIFDQYNFDLVIHFAGLKSVSESVEKPLLYYHNNLLGTINLLECMQEHNVTDFIFSSSATVYGEQSVTKYTEDLETGRNLTNPYGKTKYMIEEFLKDLSKSWPDFHCTVLRYFNPIGNHPSGLIGEAPTGTPNNLMPYIMKVATGELPELSIYGNDYDTPDGTCRRDYIHVVDLAKGHLAAMEHLKPGFTAYNLGTGSSTSVLEMVHTFEKISGRPLPYKFAPRRPGDLPVVCADAAKATEELDWRTNLTIEDAMRDTLTYLSFESPYSRS